MQALCIRIGLEGIQQTRLLVTRDLDILLQGLDVADRSHLGAVSGLRRLQRGLKSTHIVQHGLVLGDRNILRLLARGNATVLDGSGVRATLGGQLHELLLRLCEGTNVGQEASRRSLRGRVVVHAGSLTILCLHDGLRVDCRRHLLTRRGIDAVHAQDTEAVRAVLLNRRLQTRLCDRRGTRNNLSLLGELGLVGHTEFIGRARQGLLLHLIELLLASARQVGVSIVQSRTDLRLLDGEHIGHAHGRVHARLQELALILCTKRLSDARLGILKGLLLTLVVERGLAAPRVLIQHALVGARVHGLGDAGSEERHHVGVSFGRGLVVNLVVCQRLRSGRNERLARVLG